MKIQIFSKKKSVCQAGIELGTTETDDTFDPMKKAAKFWHAPDIGGLELLKATYISHTFTRHTHAGYVIGTIDRGVEVYEYRGRTHFAMPGDIVVINPDMVHTGYAVDNRGWIYRMFYPSVDLMKGLVEAMSGSRNDTPYFNATVIKDPVLAREMRMLHQVLEQSSSRLERQTHFFDVMGRLSLKHAGRPPAVRPAGPERETPAKAVADIDLPPGHNISLEELSTHVGLSPFYFSRVFTRQMGLPPHAYRKQKRIPKAKQMRINACPFPRWRWKPFLPTKAIRPVISSRRWA